MVRKKRKVSVTKQFRRVIQAGERVFSKSPVAKVLKIERRLLNTPGSLKRLKKIAKKPLIEAPQQLKGKRLRPSVRFIGPTNLILINLRRKKRRKR